MTQTSRDNSRLQADLAQLRAALRAVEAPPPDDAALRARFRAATEARAARAVPAPSDGGWRLHLAAAAVVVLAVGAVLATVMLRVDDAVPPTAAMADAPAPAPASVPVAAFQPLQSAPGLSPASAYSVVRVRIPLSAFALVPGTEESGTIEADLLIGEDGLARAIRFNDTDTMLVSVTAQ